MDKPKSEARRPRGGGDDLGRFGTPVKRPEMPLKRPAWRPHPVRVSLEIVGRLGDVCERPKTRLKRPRCAGLLVADEADRHGWYRSDADATLHGGAAAGATARRRVRHGRKRVRALSARRAARRVRGIAGAASLTATTGAERSAVAAEAETWRSGASNRGPPKATTPAGRNARNA